MKLGGILLMFERQLILSFLQLQFLKVTLCNVVFLFCLPLSYRVNLPFTAEVIAAAIQQCG